MQSDNIRFYNVIFLLIYCTIISCSKEEKIELSVSASKVEVVSPKTTFTVTSNVSWVLSKKGNYNFRVAPAAGDAGTTEVCITYAANDSGVDRESVLTITAGGSEIKTVTVVQPAASILFATDTLNFEASGGSKSVNVTSNTDWNLGSSVMPEWVKSVEAVGKSGNGEIKISVKENKERTSDNAWDLEVVYAGSLKKNLRVTQSAANNNPPSKPVILTPANNATGISVIPEFTWEASTDADGDPIEYIVKISKDRTKWSEYSALGATKLIHSSTFEPLEPQTTYYYKVIAKDNCKDGTTESDVYTFTTSDKDAYTDGEYVLYYKSPKAKPFVVIFTGDGYLAEHHRYGGLFDEDMNDAIEGLFEIEPYKTYKEYFTVYKLAAFSNEIGVTNKKTGVTVDTKFGCTWNGGNSTYLTSRAGSSAIFSWCEKIPEFVERGKKNSSVAVVINADEYAGTCTMWDTGASIAMMTYNRNAGSIQTQFVNTVKHELGGHGIGRLADEYTTSSDYYPDDKKPGLKSWQDDGAYLNVSIEPLIENSPWSHFIGLDDYSHVGMFEGANGYKKGVWKSEQTSCMISNLPYFNSPSRFLIVKRLLETAGEVIPTEKGEPLAVRASKLQKIMEIFKAKDIQKTNPYLNGNNTNSANVKTGNTYYEGWGGVPYDFIPLAPPVLLKEGEE